MFRVVWCITGSGDHLDDIVQIIGELNVNDAIRVRVLVSKAGEQVLRWYKLWDKLNQHIPKVQVEINANTPFLAGPLQLGKYDALVVAPLTANSTAKIAHGIADTLITNAVAQTLKGPTKVILYPVDQEEGKVSAVGPAGEEFDVRIRDIDRHNASLLKRMCNTLVVTTPGEIREHIYSLSLNKGDA